MYEIMTKTNHISLEQCAEKIEMISRDVPVGSWRVHWKNPDKPYRITNIVIDEATDEVAIVYQWQWSEVSFVRLAKIFLEEIIVDDKKIQRFRRTENV